jgi:hypothetical protein
MCESRESCTRHLRSAGSRRRKQGASLRIFLHKRSLEGIVAKIRRFIFHLTFALKCGDISEGASNSVKCVRNRSQVPLKCHRSRFGGCCSLILPSVMQIASQYLIARQFGRMLGRIEWAMARMNGLTSGWQLLETSYAHNEMPGGVEGILCDLDQDCLMFKVMSPVDIKVTAPSGRVISNTVECGRTIRVLSVVDAYTRRRPGDAPRADQPEEPRRSHRAHGGWAVGGVSLFPVATASRGECSHFGTSPERSQGRSQRPVSVRLGEKIQEMLRRGDGERTLVARLLLRIC